MGPFNLLTWFKLKLNCRYSDQAFNKGYWTSLTYKGCSGSIRSCYHNKSTSSLWSSSLRFWETLNTFDTGGCISFEEFLSGQQHNMNSHNYIPRFRPCNSKINFACEVDGSLENFLGIPIQQLASHKMSLYAKLYFICFSNYLKVRKFLNIPMQSFCQEYMDAPKASEMIALISQLTKNLIHMTFCYFTLQTPPNSMQPDYCSTPLCDKHKCKFDVITRSTHRLPVT